MSPTDAPTKRGRPGYDQQSVLQIAVEVFNRHGYDATSMGILAENLGISKSAIYHHVPSKGDLLKLALEEALGGLEGILEQPQASPGVPRRGWSSCSARRSPCWWNGFRSSPCCCACAATRTLSATPWNVAAPSTTRWLPSSPPPATKALARGHRSPHGHPAPLRHHQLDRRMVQARRITVPRKAGRRRHHNGVQRAPRVTLTPFFPTPSPPPPDSCRGGH